MANVKFTAKEEQFVASMQKAAGSVGVLAAKLNTDLVRSYQEADRYQKIFNKGLVRWGEDAQATGAKMTAGLTVPILGIGAAGIKAFADVEALMMGLEVVEGSADKAAAAFERIKVIAKAPGLGFTEAAQGYTNLRAVGFSAEFAEKALKNLGNAIAVSGKGKFEFGSILTQLTQMSGKSAVLAEDLKPILNAAPVIAKLVKDMYGSVDSETISNSLKAQGKGPAEFINELITALDGVKKVTGGAKNALENFGDSMKIAGSNMGEVLNQSTGLTDGITLLGDAVVDVSEWFKDLSPEMQNFIIYGTAATAAVGPLVYGVGALATALPGLITSVNMATLVTGGWITATIALGTALLVASGQQSDFEKATEPLTKTLNDATGAATKETTALWHNVEVLKTAKVGSDEFLNSKNALIALNPEFESVLKDETLNIDKLGQMASITAEKLVRMAQAKAVMSKVEGNANDIARLDRGDFNINEKMRLTQLKASSFFTKMDPAVIESIFVETRKKELSDAMKEGMQSLSKDYADIVKVLNGSTTPLPKAPPHFAKAATDIKKGKEEVKKALKIDPADIWNPEDDVADLKNIDLEIFKRLGENDFSTMLNSMGTGVPGTPLNMDRLAAEVEREKMQELYKGYEQDLEAFQANFGYMLTEGMGDALGEFFTNLGAGGDFGKSFSGMMGSLTMTLGSLLMDFGKKSLMASKAIETIKALFGSALGPGAAIAAIALGGLIKGAGQSLKTPKFAQGAIVKGPGMATVGDNPGRFEAIIPIEKMPEIFGAMVAKSGNQRNEQLVAVTGINEIYWALKRYEKNL